MTLGQSCINFPAQDISHIHHKQVVARQTRKERIIFKSYYLELI